MAFMFETRYPAAPDQICRRAQGAAGRLRRLLEGPAQAFQSGTAVIGERNACNIERPDMIDEPMRRGGAAGSLRRTGMPISRSRTCHLASSRRAAATCARRRRHRRRDFRSRRRARSSACSTARARRRPRKPRRGGRRSIRCLRSDRRGARGAAPPCRRDSRCRRQGPRPRSKRRAPSSCTAPPIAALDVPAAIGDYTDFFAGINHATNAGKLFRPDNPLMPNYKYVPIGYHGRASSIGVSGADVRRPKGQRKPANETVPTFGPCRNLDFELELGVWIGPGNELGRSDSRSRRRPITSPASACSTTGRRATFRAGSTSRSGRSSARASHHRSRRGWSRRRRWRRFAGAGAAARGRSGAAALSAGHGRSGSGALDIELEVSLLTPGLKAKGLPRTGCRPAMRAISTGPSRSL